MTPDTIVIVVAILGVGVALGTLILTTTHRSELRLNERIDALEANTKRDIADIKQDIADSEARTREEIAAVEIRLKEEIAAVEIRLKEEIAASEARATTEIKASEARATTEIKASEARTSAKFGEINEQFRDMQTRTDAGFADVNEQLRITNDRMTSIERQQARLGGLLEGLREALFQRVQQ